MDDNSHLYNLRPDETSKGKPIGLPFRGAEWGHAIELTVSHYRRYEMSHRKSIIENAALKQNDEECEGMVKSRILQTQALESLVAAGISSKTS